MRCQGGPESRRASAVIPAHAALSQGPAQWRALVVLVPMDGLELSTFALRMRCSTN